MCGVGSDGATNRSDMDTTNVPLLVMLSLGRQQNRLVLLHLDHAFRPQVKL